jgi:hypothetical protein
MPSYVDNTSVNGTQYFYVVSSTNACGESVGNSIESHGTPAATFSFAPATAVITWDDMNGAGQTGNLAAFNAVADKGTVSKIVAVGLGLTLIAGLSALPALAYLDCNANSLTAINTSACPLLAYLVVEGNPNLSSVAPITCGTLDVFSFGNIAGGIPVSVSFPNLIHSLSATGGIKLQINNGITSVSAPLATYIDNTLLIQDCPIVTTLSFPLLGGVGNTLQIVNDASLVSFSLPSAAIMAAVIITDNASLASISMPILTQCTTLIDISRNPSITGISQNSITVVGNGGITLSFNAALASISMNGGVQIGGGLVGSLLACNDNPALTSADFTGASFPGVGGQATMNFQNCGLNQAAVDALLSLAVANGFNGDSVLLDGGTNSAPTNGALNADYLTLIGAGNTVNTN